MAAKSKGMMRASAGTPWSDALGAEESLWVVAAYEGLRARMSARQEARSLAAAEAKLMELSQSSPWLALEVVEGAEYNVEGECGRWSFKTHKVVDKDSGKILHDTRRDLPKQQGERRHRTEGALKLMLFMGLSRQSGRDTSALLNYVYHQPGAVVTTTVRDFAEAEGGRIGEELYALAELELAGAAPFPIARPGGALPPVLPQDTLDGAFAQAAVPGWLEAEARANPVPLSSPDETVNVSPDAVFCKKQKESRQEGRAAAKGERKTVSAYCASLWTDESSISFATDSYESLSRVTLACLLANRLASRCCCLLSDGEQKIKEVFHTALPLVAAVFIHVLDWHHLDKRCSQLLSLALKGKEIRNAHRQELLTLLWHGCVDSAIAYLGKIPEADIKGAKHLQELAEYLRKRKGQIPVYSVRKALGLANSSNRVEKANDLLVSSRQKGKGMSWSQEGSLALARIRMVAVNHQQELWLSERRLSLEMRLLAA